MNCRAPVPLAAVLLAAAVALSCGSGRPPAGQAAGQPRHDRAVYVRESPAGAERDVLAVDLEGFERPEDLLEFTRLPHLPPVEQGKTGNCWSYATVSLLESELRRQGRAEVRLSEMFIVYWEYVEKARRFVREKGRSFLSNGSQADSALARAAQYGLVRAADYTGLPAGRTAHDDRALLREYRDYLSGLAARNDWDEARALAGVRAILDKHMGRPPDRIDVDGRSLTPPEFLASLGLRPSDYVAFVSFMYLPFYTKGEFEVPDNWRRSRDYHNLPLYEYALALLRALRKGYSAVLSVDFSEPGYLGEADVAMVPTFDIPSAYIDQSSRELRFKNGATADDHAVHCVGYLESAKGNWFLVKDSWENAYWGRHKGYFFYQEAYIRLKCLAFLVHRDAVKEVLEKFPAGP
ncbi:MAG TPA: C1 family peptidase [Candidatus Aminicenantes bacterium]|nr:C1 family peptidase [Candidatus Aminicenantes bacterium]